MPSQHCNTDEARLRIERVMSSCPALTTFGFGTFEHQGAPGDTRDFMAQRKEMLSEQSCLQFCIAGAWLNQCGRIVDVNRSASSYALKHEAERWAGRYVSNGMLIAAAVHLGYSVRQCRPGSPNVYLNISAWRPQCPQN